MKHAYLAVALSVAVLVSFSGCKSKNEAQAPAPQGMPAGHPAMTGNSMPGGQAPAGDSLTGKVVETMNSGGYTYISLEQGGKKTWVAMPETKVKVGQKVTCQPGMPMQNFTSKTLKRTFDSIIFSGGIL